MPTAALRRRLGHATWWLGLALTFVVAAIVAATVDTAALARSGQALRDHPLSLAMVLVVYGLAFVLRAVAWRRTLPDLPLRHALAALHVSLGANHVLPLRLGEVLRVTSVVRRTAVAPAAAVASTVTLRAADVLALAVLVGILGPALALDVLGGWGPPLLGGAVLGAFAAGAWSAVLRRRGVAVRIPGPLACALVIASWVFEGVVVYQAAAWAGIPLTLLQAVLVTAITVAAQVAALAPGGFGTYEAAATAALVATGVDPATALAVALVAHAIKTVYALVTGAVAVMVPHPGLLGRLRLPATRPRVEAQQGSATHPGAGARQDLQARPDAASGPSERTDAPAPVVLFMPAHDEQETVGAVVRRVPERVAGHPVRCVIVDDGSTDHTAERARAAGAQVISLGSNEGLGAAVRRGLAEGVALGAGAVAFCDADGEYAPEELSRLVEPILAGDADYVVGSRFAGTIGRMLPHRRFGNRLLTVLLRHVTRAPITDGQSGYRALSRRAAAQAEVIHDYNYAQVLTIDLLARGARYREVPITYHYRESGRSFVRLRRYLAAVVPGVHRQLNTPVTPLAPDDPSQRPTAGAAV